MRIKLWMIVVAAIVLCVVWTVVYLDYRMTDVYVIALQPPPPHPVDADRSPYFRQIGEAYLTAIGATLLAALAAGFWAVRRRDN